MPRKQVHSRAEFVTAALAYVDEHGAASLTARSLGEAMGLDPMALYRYFSGMDELASAVVDRVFGDAITMDLPEGSPRERLTALLMNVHRVCYRHPHVLALLVVGRSAQPHGLAASRIALGLLRELGLSGRDLLVCNQMLESHLLGTHLFDLSGSPHHLEIRRQRRRLLDDPEVDLWNRTVEIVDTFNQEAFMLGLDALIDRCEAVARQSKPAARAKQRPTPKARAPKP